MPLRKLCITGKDANPDTWLSKQEVAAAIASGRFDTDRTHMTVEQLIAAFDDWSPIVRGWAADELSHRPEAHSLVPKLIQLAEGKDVHAAQGASEALGEIKDPSAVPVLVRLLAHPNRWLRFKAAQAIRKIGGGAVAESDGILKAVVQTAEAPQPINWADPVQLTQGQLAAALFSGPLTDTLKNAPTNLLYPAIRNASRIPDGMARANLRGYFEHKLSEADVHALAPDLFIAVKYMCPADTMFGAEIRMGAFKALTKYHYKEGIEAGVIFAKTQGGHGSENRTGEIMKEIVTYGSAARSAIPQLKELIDELNDQCKKGQFPAGELNNRRTNAVADAIKTIEAAKEQPKLKSFKTGG